MHQLYRFYNEAEILLYIGRTTNPPARFSKHRQDKTWWDEIAKITLASYGTAEELAQAERAAIKDERPLHNVMLNGKNRPSLTCDLCGQSKSILLDAAFGTARVCSDCLEVIEKCQPPRRICCGLNRGHPYALGLNDGTCPVGLVEGGDRDGVTITPFDWLIGMFSELDRWISADRIQEWVKAEPLSKHEAERRGYGPRSDIWEMQPLGDFQTKWVETRTNRLRVDEPIMETH